MSSKLLLSAALMAAILISAVARHNPKYKGEKAEKRCETKDKTAKYNVT